MGIDGERKDLVLPRSQIMTPFGWSTSSFCSSFYDCNEYKIRRAVQVLAEKRGVGRGQQIFSGVFGLGVG